MTVSKVYNTHSFEVAVVLQFQTIEPFLRFIVFQTIYTLKKLEGKRTQNFSQK